MDSQDDTYLDYVDNVLYGSIIEMYIKYKTIEQYQVSNKPLIFWLFDKKYSCRGDAENTEIGNIPDSYQGASVQQKNKSV